MKWHFPPNGAFKNCYYMPTHLPKMCRSRISPMVIISKLSSNILYQTIYFSFFSKSQSTYWVKATSRNSKNPLLFRDVTDLLYHLVRWTSGQIINSRLNFCLLFDISRSQICLNETFSHIKETMENIYQFSFFHLDYL